MFEQTFVQTQTQARKPWTVVASLSAQCGVIAIVLLIPLLRPEMMRIPDAPTMRPISTWVTLPVTPQHLQTASQTQSTPSPFHRQPGVFYLPAAHPVEVREVGIPVVTDISSNIWQGSAAGFEAGLPSGNSLPPAVIMKPPVPPGPAGPRRVGGDVAAAKLQFSPRPVYPQLAIAVHAQGTVKLEAIIAADGSVKNLRVLSGPAMLVKAALDAVAQWKYQPTLLNGAAVEVLTEISVNFSLAR